jgi:hypothetical protein
MLSNPTRKRAGILCACTVLVGAILGGGLNAPPASADTLTVCVYQLEKPHASDHHPGTINTVAAVVTCLGDPVPDLHLDVQIQKASNGRWRTVATKLRHLDLEGNLIRVSRSKACAPGRYRTRIRLFMFGHHRPWRYSGTSLIQCATSGGGNGGGGGGGW